MNDYNLMSNLYGYILTTRHNCNITVRVLGEEGIFGSAHFISDWLPIIAQNGPSSTVVVPHGLGIVPLLVEVLVKSIDPPNDGFVFKAIGQWPISKIPNTCV